MKVQRQRLADVVADSLKRSIYKGDYVDFIPGEIQLAADFGVSRTVLRDGLAVLARDGIIRKTKGKPTRIVAQQSGVDEDRETRLIILMGSGKNRSPIVLSRELLLLYSKLVEARFIVEVHQYADLNKVQLKQLVRSRQNTLWLLFGVSKEQQLHFDQHGIPAVVLGTAYPGVNLSHVDADFHALAVHSVGLIKRHKYQRLLVVLPREILGGDQSTLAGFDTAVSSAGLSLDF